MEKELMKYYGDSIRRHRVEAGFTRKYIAYVTGMSEHTIADLELGYRNTSFTVLIKMADVMGISIDEMIGREVKRRDA